MSLERPGFNTLMVHAGQQPDPATGACAVPIYQTSSYVFESAQHAAELFNLERPGNIYTRIMNPTTDVLEKRLAALEGGVGALCVASGMAAITYAIFNLAAAGDEIVAANTLYGGTHTLFHDRMPQQYGIHVKLVDIDDLAAVEAAITEKTRALYFETLGNPAINIPDFDALAQLAHRHGIPVICDNTFGTPYLIQLKDHGVDIVVHSLTKYVGGHGTTIGGAIVDLGTFQWKDNPRFPGFNQPDAGYHGLVYADIPGEGYITKVRVQALRDTGACLSPLNAFLLLQGMETLSLRVRRHSDSALAIAQFLSGHPGVTWVNYPMLSGDKYHQRALKYLPKGVGGILTFGIRGGVAAGRKFIEALRIFSLLANVADAKSLVIHPASTTHGQMSQSDLLAAGVSPEMVRLSIGLEDVEDLIEDLNSALAAAQA